MSFILVKYIEIKKFFIYIWISKIHRKLFVIRELINNCTSWSIVVKSIFAEKKEFLLHFTNLYYLLSNTNGRIQKNLFISMYYISQE